MDINRYYRTVKYTRGVRRIVGDHNGNPYVVDEEIIENIYSKIQDGFVVLSEQKFSSGDRVIVQEGPFAGFEGVFLKELTPTERVMILLNTLQGSRLVVKKRSVVKIN
jgi:transcription antitermination factor NusG